MKKYLYLEYKRVVRSKRFWTVILIGLFFAVMQYFSRGIGWAFESAEKYLPGWGLTMYTPLPWYEYWIGGEGYGFFTQTFFLIFPLLATIPLGDSFVSDSISGYTMHMFISGKRKHYYSARFISAFLVGGIAVTLPLVVNMLIHLGTCPSICPEPANGTSSIFAGDMWALLYYTYPIIYEILYLMIDFVFGGIFSCIAVAVGIVTRNRFLPVIFPFVSYIFIDTVFAYFRLYDDLKYYAHFSPNDFLDPSQHGEGITFGSIVFVAVLLLIPTVAVFAWSARKNETL